MTPPTRILLLEDNPADAELVRHELKKLGFPIETRWVVSREEYTEALQTFAPEVILSDHSVPAFNGKAALTIARDLAPGVPLILVTASLDEETAVEYMKAGAADYVIKDRMLRLGPAVQAVLELSRSRRESEQRYRNLFEGVPIGVCHTDREGRVLDANAALVELLGYPSVAALSESRTTEWYVDPADRVNWLDLLDRHGSVRDFETRLRRLDGREIWVRETARTVRGPTGAIESYEGTVEDITERRNLEDQFRQAQKMEAIGQLAGGVAHDFNNLLTAILGHAEFLRLDLPADGPHQEDVEEIRNAVGRATALTRQLLAFSRRQVLEPRHLDLNAVITDLNRMLRRVLPENIELITALLPGVRPVLADPVQLERVLLNLVVNSRDAMPDGGKLTLETANVDLNERYLESHQVVEPGRYSVLIVSDTGEGMTPEVQRRVFEPFYTTKEQGKGTGLGLASVYGIVKQSSGYIWVYSEPSKGTTFKLYLPSVEAGSTEAAAPAAVRTGEVDGKETILLVEDDDVVRKLTRDVLERHGYSVLVASNGTRALEQVEGHEGPVDLLITDVIMPEMGGPDLARRLAGIHPSSRVLFMSGYAPGAIVHHGVLESGAPFLPKPFTPDDLARKVREVLDSRRRTAS